MFHGWAAGAETRRGCLVLPPGGKVVCVVVRLGLSREVFFISRHCVCAFLGKPSCAFLVNTIDEVESARSPKRVRAEYTPRSAAVPCRGDTMVSPKYYLRIAFELHSVLHKGARDRSLV